MLFKKFKDGDRAKNYIYCKKIIFVLNMRNTFKYTSKHFNRDAVIPYIKASLYIFWKWEHFLIKHPAKNLQVRLRIQLHYNTWHYDLGSQVSCLTISYLKNPEVANKLRCFCSWEATSNLWVQFISICSLSLCTYDINYLKCSLNSLFNVSRVRNFYTQRHFIL